MEETALGSWKYGRWANSVTSLPVINIYAITEFQVAQNPQIEKVSNYNAAIWIKQQVESTQTPLRAIHHQENF